MKPTMLALTGGLAAAFALFALPDAVSAQTKALDDARKLSIATHRFETTFIVDALPLEAKVLIDGLDIGSASDLVGKAVSVTAGPHSVQIVAAGFHPYIGSFVADSLSSANQFRVVLAPE